MSNEKKSEPATTGSLTPEPVVKKRRGRKPSKKQYFTADVDLAIQEYLASSNQAERNEKLEDFIAKQSEAIEACDQRLKQIDDKGIFYADDEIGWFFKEVQRIQEALNEFTLK